MEKLTAEEILKKYAGIVIKDILTGKYLAISFPDVLIDNDLSNGITFNIVKSHRVTKVLKEPMNTKQLYRITLIIAEEEPQEILNDDLVDTIEEAYQRIMIPFIPYRFFEK